jgi:hypothetical protein
MFPILVFPSNISLWLSQQDFSILALEVGSIEAHEFLAAHKSPVFFLYCRKSFLYCHNSNCISNIQDLCLATIALWSGDTTIDKNPDQSPRRLISRP